MSQVAGILIIALREVSMDNYRYLIGIDGGGTSCEGVLADEKGNGIARDTGGPANLQVKGIDKGIAVVKSVVEKLVEMEGINMTQVVSIVAGLAGAGRAEIRDEAQRSLEGIWPGIPFKVVTDADVALEGAFAGDDGVVLVSGTGSICFGRNASGQTARAGGWGHLLGDEGSATWVALEAIKAALQVQDGRLPAGELRSILAASLGAKDITEIVPDVYRGKLTVSQIAGLAKVVFDLSDEDHVARQIVLRAARELGKLVVAVARRLQMESGTLRVALVGGVFENRKKLIAPLRDEITRVCPEVIFKDPLMDPAMGAVLMAKKELEGAKV
jgi:N-acetylglucosamine kinase-like BadF-type ATPase